MCKTPVLPEDRQRSAQRRRRRRRLRRPDRPRSQSDDSYLDASSDASLAEEAPFVRSLFTREFEDESEHNREDNIIDTEISTIDSIGDEEQGRLRVVTPPQSRTVNEEQMER